MSDDLQILDDYVDWREAKVLAGLDVSVEAYRVEVLEVQRNDFWRHQVLAIRGVIEEMYERGMPTENVEISRIESILKGETDVIARE